jgi:uncharacterized protein (UPF0548 family)
MIALTRPSETTIQAFLDGQRGLPFSYPEVGATFGQPPEGYVHDHHRIGLGEGERVFERACAALKNWAMCRVDWVEVWPREAPVEEGTTVALLARGFGFWCLFGCRIVRVERESMPVEAFGFAYGTLPGHVLRGEERFTVRWDRANGPVWYELDALSRPGSLLGRLGHPFVRRIQRRFPTGSLRAMSRAVGGGEP